MKDSGNFLKCYSRRPIKKQSLTALFFQGEDHTEYFIGLTPAGVIVLRGKVKVSNYFWYERIACYCLTYDSHGIHIFRIAVVRPQKGAIFPSREPVIGSIYMC